MLSKPKVAAILLTVEAVAAMLLPFLSATLLTIGLGGIAFAAGLGQFLRLNDAEGLLQSCSEPFRICHLGAD